MSVRPPLPQRTVRGFITWLSYVVAAMLAVSLSAPDLRISPLYLPAGLALALLMGWGPVALPGIGLGAGTVVAATTWMQSGIGNVQELIVLSAVGGVAAALQAWTAWRLTVRRDGRPVSLETPGDIARFLLLAGPVACLISAGLSVGARAAMGVLPWAGAPSAFLAWWTGDTLGVLVGTPMVLTLVGQPAALWRARRHAVGIPLLVATVLLGLGVRQIQVWGQAREDAAFAQDAQAVSRLMKLRLNSYTDALTALAGVVDAADQARLDTFTRAAAHWASVLPGVQAAGWVERLYAADVPLFEMRQQQEGFDGFRVHEGMKDAKGAMSAGAELAAVRYAEPRAGNEASLGFNVLSVPALRQAYEQARRENRVIATAGLPASSATGAGAGAQTALVILRPVFHGQPYTPQARVQANLGAVFLRLQMDDAIMRLLEGRPSYMEACLIDTGVAGRPLLGGTPACRAGRWSQASAHRALLPLEFGGRQWQLALWSASPVPLAGLRGTYWVLAVGGVALAAALGALLLVMTGHARRMEAAMDETRAQKAAAEQANQAKSEFLSRMSHELRTPLNAVLGFAQVMSLDQREPLPPSQRERVEQIQQAGWHLLDMIDDVLDISRIDMGMLKLQATPLRVHDELAIAVKLMQEEAGRQGVTLTLEGDIPTTWGVNADAGRLRQILSHLVGNGIQFNRRGGQVRVLAAHGGPVQGVPQIRITIRDTGLGMSEAQLAQLFQPFNRLGREQGPTSGTGIGLVISRHLAQLMGGEIEVVSREGEGSTFTLSLPAVDMPAKAVGQATEPAASRPTQESPGRPRHVLYVEDNEANSEVIRSALVARPWIKVTVAPTTEEGLAVLHNRLRGSKPDLILLDVHLPDASGQELLRLIKANPDTADIPVIMISADAMPEQIDEALTAGAACYMTKPVQLSALLRQVDELLS